MRVPLRGQQSPNQEQLVALQQAQDAQAIRAMAGSMYVQLAVAHLANVTRNPFTDEDVNPEYLRPLAKKCMIAAKAFFDGIGVIQTKNDSEVEPDVEVRGDERRV